jgi:hypothetical protein
MGTGKQHWLKVALIIAVTAAGAKQARSAVTPRRPDSPAARVAGTRGLTEARGVLLAQDEPPPGVEVAMDPGVVYPTAPPPDPIPEYQPPAPGYGYVWVNGYWDWTGYEWTWNSGFWAPRQEGVRFYAPRFVFVNGEPVYYRAYWADPYGRREYGYGWRGAPPPAWRARPSVAPTMWRTQHAESWRRVPGAPTVWRAPARREFVGGRPGMEPRRIDRGPAERGPAQRGPAMMGRPGAEPGRPAGGMRAGEVGNRAPMGGMRAGEVGNRAPMGGMPHGAPAAPHPMATPAHPATAPAPHAAPAVHRR